MLNFCHNKRVDSLMASVSFANTFATSCVKGFNRKVSKDSSDETAKFYKSLCRSQNKRAKASDKETGIWDS